MTNRSTLPPDAIKKLQEQIDGTKTMNEGKGLIVHRYIGDLLKSVGIVEGYVVQGRMPRNETGETMSQNGDNRMTTTIHGPTMQWVKWELLGLIEEDRRNFQSVTIQRADDGIVATITWAKETTG